MSDTLALLICIAIVGVTVIAALLGLAPCMRSSQISRAEERTRGMRHERR